MIRPANEREVVIETNSREDDLGRRMFTAYWLRKDWTPEGVRAQVFKANLQEHIKLWERRGYTVKLLEGVQ